MRDLSRRRFVHGTGAAMALAALAGCSGNGNGNGDGGDVPQEIDDHLSGANGYDGSIVDMTGGSEVTVAVGAGSNAIAFDPAAVRISAGTTVVWEWTGDGGGHNVASVEGSESDFTSGDDYVDEEGHTYEQSFDNTGVQLYVCEPHKAQGMKGAIDVVE